MAEDAATPKGKGPLTGKIAGQPAWIWIVGVVVLAIGVQWYRQRSIAVKAAATPINQNPPVDPSTMGTGTLPAGPGAPAAQAGPVMTTEQWLAAALNAAKNAGEDPLHASRALNAFLNGGNLSYADTLVVNAAVDAVGTPPGYSSIPPGTWADRPLPTPTVTGLVRPANQAGVFAQYSDGVLRWIQDPQELNALVAHNRNLVDANNNVKIAVIPVNDPMLANAQYGVGGVDAYHAAGGGVPLTTEPGPWAAAPAAIA